MAWLPSGIDGRDVNQTEIAKLATAYRRGTWIAALHKEGDSTVKVIA